MSKACAMWNRPWGTGATSEACLPSEGQLILPTCKGPAYPTVEDPNFR